MRPVLLAAPIVMLFSACAGDNHTTEQSPGQPTRFATSGETRHNSGSNAKFVRTRIYQITRLESSELPRAEWRALGETIRQSGSTIEFVELGSGKTVSFTGPHQITPTNSSSDRVGTQVNSEDPGRVRSEAPAPTPRE